MANPTTAGSYIFETIKTVVVVAFFALLIRTYLLQPFIVDGRSMQPNYETNDYLLIDKLSYRFREPARGEVVVFQPPNNQRENYIKRVIGLPGERVQIKNGEVYIVNNDYPSGKPLHEIYLGPSIRTDYFSSNQSIDVSLKANEYFLLGDNRPASTDSRSFGPVKKDLIIGRSLIRLFPLNDARVFAHSKDPLVQ